MPELPEVETIARGLHCGRNGVCPIVGKQVEKAHLLWSRTLANTNARQLQRNLAGQVVQSVGRRGKFVVITFTTHTLLIHLRMSGDLRVEPSPPAQPLKHDRLVIDFSDGTCLAFNDPRKFGRAWLTAHPQQVLGSLGPEPLDHQLTPAHFHHMLTSRQRQLKPLLLDQTFLAGLGNIYTDEALHLARLHPLQNSKMLTLEQATALLKAIRSVLQQGIQRNGVSIDWVYRGGDFQNQLRVYQRDGQPCPVCGAIIQRTLIGQRGTHFCPNCQKIN